MKEIVFYKLHGTGNDYIFIDCFDQTIDDLSETARRLSELHFSVGSDGVVYISPSNESDAEMRMFNSDGSEGLICGNALRCIGKILCDKRQYYSDCNTNSKLFPISFTVKTQSGIKRVTVHKNGLIEAEASVDMGQIKADKHFNEISVCGNSFKCIFANAGNPHCVVFCKDPLKVDIEKYGSAIEKLPIFPKGVNVEFAALSNVEDKDSISIRMRVWERGSGITLACGSGACAVAAAAIENGLVKRFSTIKIKCDGGELEVSHRNDGGFDLKGNAVMVFKGAFLE